MALLRGQAAATAQTELGFWNEVYDNDRIHYPKIIAAGAAAMLLLPLFHPLTEDDKRSEGVANRLKQLFDGRFWRKQVAHGDVRWANVGWWLHDGAKTLVLFDLANCKRCEDYEEARSTDMARLDMIPEGGDGKPRAWTMCPRWPSDRPRMTALDCRP